MFESDAISYEYQTKKQKLKYLLKFESDTISYEYKMNNRKIRK